MSPSGPPQRITVVSDLHANALATQAVLATARARGYDQLVILGDLLTYGCRPAEVLELVEGAVAEGALLVRGNHDQLYTEMVRGEHDGYMSQLSPWVRETAEWTAERIDLRWFTEDLPWRDEVVVGEVVLAHANPFGPGDWTYLNRPPELGRAVATLAERRVRLGVFGHTHRPLVAAARQGGNRGEPWVGRDPYHYRIEASGPRPVVATTRAVGQPRSSDHRAGALELEIDPGGTVAVRWLKVDYDRAAHLDTVRASALSKETQRHLLGYFVA